MWRIIYFIVRYGGAGILSYAMPRLLIASGVPLDSWIKSLPVWFNHEVAYWLLVAIIGVFIISLTYLVPHLISRKRRNQIEVSSPLKIEVQEDGIAYFRVEDEKGHFPQGSKNQVLSIRVYSKEAINDVKVYISEIETFSYDNDTLQNLLPIRLNFKNVIVSHPVSFSADETQQVDVVSYSSGRQVCNFQLEQFGEGEKPEVFISSSPVCCKIQIKIYGKNVSSSQQSFKIYYKEPLQYNYANNSKQRIFMKRISEEQQHDIIDSQQKTIESLKEQPPSSKLKINFKQGEHPWVKEQPGRSNGKDYIFSIELMNLGSGNIHNPKVRLFIKSSENDTFKEQWDLQVNSKDIPKTDEEGEGELVGVLKYFKYTEHKIGDDHLWMIGSEKENNNKKAEIPVQKYDIKIRASSDNGGEPVIEHFRFIPRPRNPKASMEMIEPIRSEKALELEKWINKYITIEPDLHHNPNAIVKYRYESKLLEINNFCATYRLENGKPYSVPLEKILLSKDDEHERLKLIIMP